MHIICKLDTLKANGLSGKHAMSLSDLSALLLYIKGGDHGTCLHPLPAIYKHLFCLVLELVLLWAV